MTPDQRRDAIVDAALAVALEKGLAATTVRDVAASMGTSSGLIHHYFDSMDEVLGDGRLGQSQVVRRDALEGGRQDLVHRVEVVVDQAARRAHLGGHIAHGRRTQSLAAGNGERGVEDRLAAVIRGEARHRVHDTRLLRNCPTTR